MNLTKFLLTAESTERCIELVEMDAENMICEAPL